MPIHFEIDDLIPAPVEEVYEAWLDSQSHSEMTGGKAEVSNETGAQFTAHEGYIQGQNVELEKGRQIHQLWRTKDFKETDVDSHVRISFYNEDGQTRIKLHHTFIPDGQPDYRDGWKKYYLEPMKNYFSK